MESRIQDCLGFPYMMSPTDKDPFNLHRLFFNYMIFSIKITEVIKPDPMDYDEDKKLITWCQERIKGFVQCFYIMLTVSSYLLYMYI